MRSVQHRGNRTQASSARRRIHAAVIESLERRQLLSANVVMWHNDPAQTGLNSNEQSLTPADVNSSSFGKLFSYSVTGQVYAQPLYVSNLSIPGQGTHNVVFVETMNNDVYAFDADSNSGATAGLLWHVNLGPAATVPSPFIGFRYGPDHDTTPLVGITGTPVIDLASGTMYVDAFTNDVAGQDVYSHHIHALDITTGQDKVASMLVSAQVQGNGVGGDGTTVTFAANRQIQRSALRLLDGVLYVAYAAFADTNPYHGWLLGFDASTLQLVRVLNTTPNLDTDAFGGEGGIWQSGGGLATDGTHLFLETGNGDFNTTVGDYGDSVLEISRDSTSPAAPNLTGYGLGVTDYFTPFNEQSLSNADADLGSGGPILLPDQPGAHPHELLAIGKQGFVYLIDRDNMGHHTTTTDNVIQTISLGTGFWGNGAYFNSSVYYHGVSSVLKRYSLTNGLLSAAPAAQSSITYPTWPGATPSISSNGNANGIVWDVQFETSHQVLHAYNATTLAQLYNSSQNPSRDQMGAGVKFIAPTIADGHVFVGSSGALSIYGLIQPVTTAPAAPSNLLATAQGPTSVQLSWVDNSDVESGFKIERSTDGTSFSQIDLVGVDVRSYTDTNAAPNTTYSYRVRATNAIGDSAYTNIADATTLPPTGAVNLYHFDAGAGTSVIDSASGNNGTLVGAALPQWVAGRIGSYALSFSGDGVYNQTASESAVSLTSDLSSMLGATSTLDFWVLTTQKGSNSHYVAPAITGSEQFQGANDINWGTIDSTGRMGLFVGDAGGVYSTAPVNDGQWHNIAMTRNAASGQVQIFVDGVLNAATMLDIGNKTTPFSVIGALTDLAPDGATRTGANYFNGRLDEVRIYNAVLGANEIAALATAPAAPVLQSVTLEAGPVAHLSFTSPSTFAQSIEIDRKVGVDGTFSPLDTVPGSQTDYDDTTISAGNAYYYALKAIDNAGSSSLSNSRVVMPPIPTIVGIYTFYNRSSFDGQNGSSNLTDLNAIASDKQPLLPGHTASFSNYTSYSRGLNGIIIDVANMSVLPRVDDFIFKVGNNDDPSTWTQAPTPGYINTYPGRGVDGSTQITIIWDDNAIQNEWVEVTVVAQPHLGLASNTTFYFGNAIGDTGDSASDALTTSADAGRINGGHTNSATITNVLDINRDGVVDSSDASIVNANQTDSSNAMKLISLGSAPAIVDAASASPTPVTGTTTSLSVLGADNAGEASLSYTWSLTGTPPAPVTFSANGTHSAKNTIATFSAAGAYEFVVTITNGSGISVTSPLTVQVNQTATAMSVSPNLSSIAAGTSQSFAAMQLDQFGDPMATQVPVNWSVSSGLGNITTAGSFTAAYVTGSTTVTASAGSLVGNETFTVMPDPLALYAANESAGTALSDSSGNNQSATLTGAAAFAGGVSGNALALSGGYATLPAGIASSLNDFTIAAWINPSALAAWSRVFDFGSNTTFNMFLTPDAGDTGKLRYAITVGGNGAEQRLDGPTMATNTWTHVTVTLSGNTGILYVNGVAVAENDSMTLHPTNLGFTTQNYLGKSQYPDPAFNGSIDDFRVYSRALTAQQVTALATPINVIRAPSSSPTTVTGTTAALSALAAQTITGNDTGLTYRWSAINNPPAAVTFSANGTNAAKNTTATFTAAGSYTLQVLIAGSAGQTTSATVNVVVGQVLTSVAAASANVIAGTTVQMTARDQFGGAISGAAWSTSAGLISSSGLLVTPASNGTITVTGVIGANTRNATVTAVAPQVWNKADSATGGVLSDASGNNHNAALSGAFSSGAGQINNALKLSGGSGQLANGIVSGLNDFTITAWVNLDTLATWARVFDFGSGTNTYMFLTTDSSTGRPRFAITTGGGGGEQIVDSSLAVTTGSWNFFAVTLSGTNATLYLNGQVVGTRANTTLKPSSLGNTTQNYIGKSQYPADPNLLGSIDDFRIYNIAASSSAILAMYAAGNAFASAAPSNAAAVATSSTTVSVTWQDNAPVAAEVGYLLERATDQGFTNGLASVLLPSQATSYSDTTVSAGTRYFYRITAQLAAGTNAGPIYAPAVTTPAAPVVTFVKDAVKQRLDYDFGASPVPANVTATSLSLTNVTTSQTIQPANLTITQNVASFAFPGYTAGLPDGWYQAQLNGGFTFTFYVLAGDANGDGVVNSIDFDALASHFNQSQATLSQGDFNYDGIVNALDFNAIASGFGKTASSMPGAPQSAAQINLFSSSSVQDQRDDLDSIDSLI